MYKLIKIQIGFLFEPIYHTLKVPVLDVSSYQKYDVINNKIKTNNYVKDKFKSARKSRHSTF